jgi:hypothetical protein
MVTPGSILELAETLALRGDEASLRCAASRAYYAVFLHHRRQARMRGSLPEGYLPNVHRRGEDALQEQDPEAATWFKDLRELRNRADYDDDDEFSVGLAGYALALGTQLLDR